MPSACSANSAGGEGGEGGEGEIEAGGARSDGSLLERINITIADPTHKVSTGQVWTLGNHTLVVADVLTGWAQWVKYLDEESCIFAPYPGPFVPLTLKAQDRRLVMVQPDVYIAGHILDRYAEIHGEEEIHCG